MAVYESVVSFSYDSDNYDKRYGWADVYGPMTLSLPIPSVDSPTSQNFTNLNPPFPAKAVRLTTTNYETQHIEERILQTINYMKMCKPIEDMT